MSAVLAAILRFVHPNGLHPSHRKRERASYRNLVVQELLGCRVDLVTEDGLKARVRERVLREAVPL